MISLCMIVKDEEAFLADCLRAACPAVDEIVVVDTGSTDRTVEIAGEFDAKIIHFAWNDDFSAARNKALEAASGDWILALDADEILDISDPEALRRAAGTGRHSGFMMPVVSRLEEGRLSTCMMMRFFVNSPEIRYRFIIHEQVLPDLVHYAQSNNKPISHLDVKIDHRGYEPKLMNSREKKERNDKLFRKQLRLYPRDLYSWYKYAEFLAFVNDDRKKLHDTLRRAFDLMRGLPAGNIQKAPYAAEIGAYLAIELFEHQAAPDAALEVLTYCMDHCLPTPHLFFVYAEIERQQGRYQDALIAYERCMAFEDQELMVPVKEGVTTWKSLSGIAWCRLDLQEIQEANASFLQAMERNRDALDPYVGLAQAAYRTGDLQEALKWMMKLIQVKPDCALAWQTGRDLLAQLGMHDKAAEWDEKASRLTPSSEALPQG